MLMPVSSDTLRRHMRTTLGLVEPARMKFACTGCRKQKIRCQGGSPCNNCLRRGLQCSLAQKDEDEGLGQQPGHISSLPEKERHYIGLYFELFHPYWSFIHRGSFKESDETPLLVQSMVVIGLWLSNVDNAQSRAIALHNVLHSALCEQMVCSRQFPIGF